jgi:hypothetical protein
MQGEGDHALVVRRQRREQELQIVLSTMLMAKIVRVGVAQLEAADERVEDITDRTGRPEVR